MMTDDHPIWTQHADGSQGWGTYNYSHYLWEGDEVGAKALMRGKNKHTTLNGWLELEPIYQDDYGPRTELVHLFVEDGSYVCDGLVVSSKLAQIGKVWQSR